MSSSFPRSYSQAVSTSLQEFVECPIAMINRFYDMYQVIQSVTSLPPSWRSLNLWSRIPPNGLFVFSWWFLNLVEYRGISLAHKRENIYVNRSRWNHPHRTVFASFQVVAKNGHRTKIQPTVVDFLKDTFPESGTCCRLMEDALTWLWLDENC